MERYLQSYILKHKKLTEIYMRNKCLTCLKKNCVCVKLGLKNATYVKYIYSEKATKFCEIFTLLLSNVVPIKSNVKILQNFVAFSEYMNFM